MNWKIHNNDILKWAVSYDGPLFHAIVCDPPYNLDTIKKRFGKKNSAPAKFGTDGVFQRSSKGFMGQEWDTDIAFQPETWEVIMEVLHPGALCMAFSSTRTYHRMATAIEEAGFIIHPMIGWIQGQGFPKATNVSKLLHKRGEIQAGVTWEEHRYGLQALKPSLEPICVFQKPFEGKPLDSVVETGAGTIWIEGNRVGEEIVPNNTFDDGMKPFGHGAGHPYTQATNKGRWPANVVITHSPDCTDAECVNGCGVKELDSQSGILKSGLMKKGTQKAGINYGIYSPYNPQVCSEDTIADSGGASRFFYCAKAHRSERDAGLNELPDAERFTTYEGMVGISGDRKGDGKQKPIPVGKSVVKNTHPTVKPIKLTEHLTKLLLPPEEYNPRRLLVPFCGSGSEMIGGLLSGWDEIVGVEIEADSCEIANKRLEYWTNEKE